MPNVKRNLPEEDQPRKLESRVTASSSSSSSAPLDLNTELSTRRSRLQSLITRAGLDATLAEAERITTRLQALPARMDDLNKRGYRYGNTWGGRLTTLKNTWDTQRSIILTRLN
ncbi:MAG: hypothetical protein N2556_09845, partial [Anaerolineae bacterium]|nr:hypothetical protein [Anaerolineae bacterium]